ncbi:hypothetical protein [Campylobacter upsaliensis]|uniref:DUF115 domain-containing protein n=2 Tax=Campylobacter upsaliensis TaxID=28080 RepID=A0A381EGW5_CAMUP|nr:hypothetical protein [Campylobacter upsaliensis]SUX26182.1 Uncharacterised protein [Campylobacter upsaliensis]
MCREEFELKLKEAGFKNEREFAEKIQMEEKKIQAYLEKNKFPNYFNFLFECLISLKDKNIENLRKNEDGNLKLRLKILKEENKNLIEEFHRLKNVVKE